MATQLDFLVAITVLIGGISLYFFMTGVLIDLQAQQDSSASYAGFRAEERLVNDVLKNGTSNATMTPGCSRSFFSQEKNLTCGFRGQGTDQAYLRGVLGLSDTYTINVTITNSTGVLLRDPTGGPDLIRHASGPPVPQRGTVTSYERTVTYGADLDGDSRIDHYTAKVSIWGGT